MVNVGIFKTRPTAIMRQLKISLTVQLFFVTIASGSFLDFVFHSSRHPSEQSGRSEVPASGTDPSQRIWNMVPVNDLTSSEISLVNRLKSFAERAPSSDCFKRSLSTLKTKCGEELEPDEGERVRLAISMTLCELETAAYASIPLECLEFSYGTKIRTPEHKTAPQAVCVAALSRSPQHWSSYSGYLRDVPQLCFAFRRWHDIDTGRNFPKLDSHIKLARGSISSPDPAQHIN